VLSDGKGDKRMENGADKLKGRATALKTNRWPMGKFSRWEAVTGGKIHTIA